MYKLFYADGSAAMSTRAVLEEIGAAYDLIQTDISHDKPRAPELLKLNPNGWVPVLVYDGGTMHEASAITIFLTDRHPGAGLAPAADDPARGPFLQWLVYMSNTLQIAYQLTYHWDRYCAGPDAQASVQQKSCSRLREVWASSTPPSAPTIGWSRTGTPRPISISTCCRRGSRRNAAIRPWTRSPTPNASPTTPPNVRPCARSTDCDQGRRHQDVS